MISISTVLLQAFGAALIAVCVVWSTYQTYRILLPNNRWFRSLSLLPAPLNMGIRAFIVFELMFLFGDLIWLIEPSIHKMYFYALTKLGFQGAEAGIGISVLFFGVVAFVFKLEHPRLYGLTELLVAITLGALAAKQIRSPSPAIGEATALIGAVYIVSRGMGNILDGWKPKMANRDNVR